MIELQNVTMKDVPLILEWENNPSLQELTLTPFKYITEQDVVSQFVRNGGAIFAVFYVKNWTN